MRANTSVAQWTIYNAPYANNRLDYNMCVSGCAAKLQYHRTYLTGARRVISASVPSRSQYSFALKNFYMCGLRLQARWSVHQLNKR